MALTLVVLGGCTSDADDDPTDAATSSTDGADAPSEDGRATDEQTATDAEDGDEAATDDATDEATDDDATDQPAAPAPSVSEVPSDASDVESARAIITQLYALEHVVREDLAARAQDGDTIGEVRELVDRFTTTRTLDAATIEAEELAVIGSENLALFTEGGVREPTITDVAVEESRTGCIVMTATSDVLTTYNDQGQVDLRYRLVTGAGNGTGWLIDRISTGQVPGC